MPLAAMAFWLAWANELSNGRSERPLGFTIIAPCPALAQERWGGSDCETAWVEALAHLVPVERHRHRSSATQPWRKRGDCGRHAIVAQIVEKDAACSLLLGHVEEISIGAVVCHLATHSLGEAFGLLPSHAVVTGLQGGDHVDTLASRGFAEGDEAEPFEALAQLLRRRDNAMKWDVG